MLFICQQHTAKRGKSGVVTETVTFDNGVQITSTTVGSLTNFPDPRQDIIKKRKIDTGSRQVLSKGSNCKLAKAHSGHV